MTTTLATDSDALAARRSAPGESRATVQNADPAGAPDGRGRRADRDAGGPPALQGAALRHGRHSGSGDGLLRHKPLSADRHSSVARSSPIHSGPRYCPSFKYPISSLISSISFASLLFFRYFWKDSMASFFFPRAL